MRSVFKSRSLLTGLVVAGVLLFGVLLGPVYGDELTDLKDQQDSLSRQMNQTEERLDETKQQANTISGRLRSLSNSIDKITARLEEIQGNREQTEQEIEQTEAELKEAQDRLDERIQVLSERLKGIYQQGDVSYLEVLLEATDFKDFLVRFNLLEKIAEQDVQLVDEIKAEREQIEAKKAELEQKRQHLLDLEAEADSQREELEHQKADQQKLLNDLDTQKAAYQQALKELEEASNQIAARIREIEARNGNTRAKVSKLAWPLPGYTYITSDYGWRTHPITGVYSLHTGVDIRAGTGTPIYSAESGVVIYAGWLGAYGNAVVIDHDGTLSTLYGHMSQILVREGQSVSYQQVIGKVGSTGWATGPHLHFEVRVNGDPVNPWNYVSKY